MKIQESTYYFAAATALLGGGTYVLMRGRLPKTTLKVQMVAIGLAGVAQLLVPNNLEVVLLSPPVLMGLGCAWGNTSLKVALYSMFFLGFSQMFLGLIHFSYLPIGFLDRYEEAEELNDEWLAGRDYAAKAYLWEDSVDTFHLEFFEMTASTNKEIKLSVDKQKALKDKLVELNRAYSFVDEYPFAFFLLARLDQETDYKQRLKDYLDRAPFPILTESLGYIRYIGLLTPDECKVEWEKVLTKALNLETHKKMKEVTTIMRYLSFFFVPEDSMGILNGIQLARRQYMTAGRNHVYQGDSYLVWWVALLVGSRDKDLISKIEPPPETSLTFAEASNQSHEGISREILTLALKESERKEGVKEKLIPYLKEKLKGFADLDAILK